MQLLHDFHVGLRSLLRDKAFSGTVVATLAVCIAAHSVTFAIVNSVLLRPLPVPEADSLVLMANRYPGAGAADSNQSAAGDYFDRQQSITVFSEQAMFDVRGQTLEIENSPQRVESMRATPSLFRLLQVPTLIGRAFDDSEGEIGADDKVILSYALWQTLFAGDADAIGRELRLTGRPHTVVGVMPRDFSFVNPEVALWTPLAFSSEQRESRHSNSWINIGRLKPNATLAQAQAQVDALNAANLDLYPAMRQILLDTGFHTAVLPLQEMIVGDVESILYLLWGGALFVLLIGALNIANLALVRLTLREKDFATRSAMGAEGFQVIRQFLVENLTTALVGGLAGVGLGFAMMRGLQVFGLQQLPRANEIAMDATTVGVALAMSLAVGAIIGLTPLKYAFRSDPNRSLRSIDRGGTSNRGSSRLRGALVATQIGCAFVLLLGAGLLLASFRELLRVDPGFRTEGVLTLSTRASGSAYPGARARREFMRRALPAIRAVPGVVEAGATSSIPFGTERSDSVIFAEGYQMEPGESVVSPRQIRVTPGYFEAMGVELVQGRYFDDRDNESSSPVIIVDERLARRFWPNDDPLGRRMYQPQDVQNAFKTDENTRWLTVVGVVNSVRQDDLAGSDNPGGAYYFPFSQSPQSNFTFAVQAQGDPVQMARSVRAAIAQLDPGLALFGVQTMSERTRLSLASERTALTLAGGFGGVALFLSAIGIYGLLAYYVAQRRREIGIRVALGSTAGNVVKLVFGEGMKLAGLGLALGLAGAVLTRGILANEVYGVAALDPWVIGGVVALLGLVVAMSAVVPASRASRIDPARAIASD